ncbi:MAG: MarR family transcriptional regulator [Firmicutes bacterium]|jgi:DNA-binding MarR family transcriptional regulator|nr:MarR family transcriptional regulator [Bacillota bacterium]MDH7496725.1 MarR family transcriptional regulator [Bacillota bacterium]
MPAQPNLEQYTNRLNELILTIGQRLLRFFASKSSDFTLREMFVLELLGSRESPATMSELASALAVPLTTMSSLVNRMVHKGYLERYRTEEDRRIVLVRLSPAGRAVFDQHRRDYVRSVSEVLGTLSSDDQQKLLGLIGDVLTAMSGGPSGRGGRS